MRTFLFFVFISIPTWAVAAPAVYTVHCSVSGGPPADKVLADNDFVVSSNKDVTVARDGAFEMTVGVSEVRPPNGDIQPLILLTIKKHGKVVAHSMTDFDAKKPGNVNLWKNQNSPRISCRPHPKI